LLTGLSCALIGGAIGFFVGQPPSEIGGRLAAFIGAGIAFVAGIGLDRVSFGRLPCGLLGGVLGMCVGVPVGHFLIPEVGARLASFVLAWLGFAVGTSRTLTPIERYSTATAPGRVPRASDAVERRGARAPSRRDDRGRS
jgi:hypothetical protein